MKKLILLLIACSMISSVSYSQECDSISIKEINLLLTTGISCCEELTYCDSIIYTQALQIDNLEQQVANTDAKFNIKHFDWNLADSSYKATVYQLNESAYDVQRLKKGKRNWIIATLLIGLGVTAYELLNK